MTPLQVNLDLTAATTAVFALLFGNQMAAYVGPYSVILLGAAVGTAWSLGRRDSVTSNNSAFKYFLLMAATALIFTVPLAEWLGARIGSNDAQYLFAPVAMLIGGVGADWPKLLHWVGGRAMRIIERKAGVEGDDK